MDPYIFKVPMFGPTLFFLCIINFSQNHHLYSRLISKPQLFEHLGANIAKHFMQITEIFPTGSKVRRLAEVYLSEAQEVIACTQDEMVDPEVENTVQRSICTYRMLRRIRLLQIIIAQISFSQIFGRLSAEVVYFFWQNGWPHFEDVECAVEAILRLQILKNLVAQQFDNSFGASSATLNSPHCYEIASGAFKTGKYFLAMEWLELAKQKVLVDEKASAAFIDFLFFKTIRNFLPLPEAPTLSESPVEQVRLGKYSLVSPNGLNDLVRFEYGIYLYIKHSYATFSKQRNSMLPEEFDETSKDLKMYLDDFEESTGNILEGMDNFQNRSAEIENVSGNAIAAYRLVSRIREYLHRWARLQAPKGNRLMLRIGAFLKKVYDINEGPNMFDFQSTIFAILNIQFIYDLSAKEIASGFLNGLNANVTLRANDCFIIGKHGISLNFFILGIDWLEHALDLVQNSSDTSAQCQEIRNELDKAMRLHDEGYGKTSDQTVYFYKPLGQVHHPSRRITRKVLQYKAAKISDNLYKDTRFCGVCNGKIRQTDKMKSRLFCWYEREIHPSFKISPIKVELHSMYPKVEVVQYHDVISGNTIEALKNFAHQELLHDVKMGASYGKMSQNPLQRVSKLPWGNAKDKEVANGVAKLINRLTGLQTVNKTHVAEVSVSAYTPGRFAARHFDWDRAATFILYLSDLQKGGETAFVNAAVRVAPRKGSAIFWHNHYSCGQLNPRAEHGACPAIFGIKWIAVLVGIYYDRQHHLQCHLKRKTEIKILANGKSTVTVTYKYNTLRPLI